MGHITLQRRKKILKKSKLMLDFLKNDGIINLVHDFGELCNGSTTDSDSVCWGSNPYSPANTSEQIVPRLFYARIPLFTAAFGHFFFASKYRESL